MQDELDAMSLPMAVHLLGVNAIGAESANATTTAGRDIPWLQDNVAQQAWDLWAVDYRDVFVLDEDGRVLFVYSLLERDLTTPFDYDELKGRLVQAAGG